MRRRLGNFIRTSDPEATVAGLRERAISLRGPADLDALIERIGDAQFVLLGEASHGTSEFYTWRAELSRRLISEHDFSFVAVEGDWPDCYRVNRFVKGYRDAGTSAYDVLHAFARWPTWMWANREVEEFATWMRDYNAGRALDARAGFYGLDVYSLYESMDEVVHYLERVDPPAAREARRAYMCFEPYGRDVQEYARATVLVPTHCEDEAIETLIRLRERAPRYATADDGRDALFNAEQNALIARNGELYYRTMVRGGAASWNVRDHHMTETLDRLVAHHGPRTRAIVWEHNTHVGDARFTDMARSGMVNVGQLVRQAHEREGVVLVGFSTYRGTVIAAEEWGLPMERMRVPDAEADSHDELLHRTGCGECLLVFDPVAADGGVPGLDEVRGQRAIGVVYNPEIERWGNYVPTILPKRYDALIFVDETHAVDPLHMPTQVGRDVPETYPTGM